ncbi:MAG: type I glutamate--ammonia ligase [Dehalococcoidia bacterium]|nr:type I glutamate--ammonia ligase [Dehalococcoidia bacterium]
MTPEEVIKKIRDEGIQIIDLKFTDLPGMWQHLSITASEISVEMFTDGLGFDGSSIHGFQKIEESDMLLVPDADTAVMDPVHRIPTLSLVCDIVDPIREERYSRDPRYIALKAEQYLKSTGIADTAYFGPEAEFFVFDDVRYGYGQNEGYHFIDSDQGAWNTGRDEDGANLGYKIRTKEGYFPVPPHDTMQDMRSEMVLKMIEAGIQIEVHHHEVATAGQNEIDMRFDTLRSMADKLMMYKYIVKNVARAYGKVATFMPKPLFGDNGSGMHVHSSLWKGGENLFYDAKGYAQISDMCKYYIGGILKHGPALMGICAPTTNSYKRLVPGYEAPVNLVYSARNRSAACRIPMVSKSPKAKRVEFRPPDAMANPYLAFPAIMMAGLDGIQNKIDPGKPTEGNLFELEGRAAKRIPTVPGSLDASLAALERDHEFLLKGNVFTKDVIETWLDYKRENEVDPVRLRPHPYEFMLYFDA